MEKDPPKESKRTQHVGRTSQLEASAFDGEGSGGTYAKPPAFQLKASSGNAPIQRKIADSEIQECLQEIDKNPDGFDIKKFFAWQSKIDVLKPEYRTMGPEFEFAKLDVEELPLHAEVAKTGPMINNWPFILETDSGNVLEMACPPFVISTATDDFDLASSRAMAITNRLEKILKGKAIEGAGSDKDMNWLLEQVEAEFGIYFSERTEVAKVFGGAKLIEFTKGANFANEYYPKEDLSNAQINIKMTTEEIGEALKAEDVGNSDFEKLKAILSAHFGKALASLKKKGALISDDGKGMSDAVYSNKISIISYYVSQIPFMALQMLMNEIRRQNKVVFQEDKEQNRLNFTKSHPQNYQLMVKMSGIKDYLGFWIKASLGDMMLQDPVLKEMVMYIDRKELKATFKKTAANLWKQHKDGLAEYAGSAGLEDFNTESIDGDFEWTVGDLVDKMVDMAENDKLAKPKGREVPQHEENGTQDLMDVNKDEDPAPFMTRPDTHVGLAGGHLVEIRGITKRIGMNPYLRRFLMPFYRKAGEMANENNWRDYHQMGKPGKAYTAVLDFSGKELEKLLAQADGLDGGTADVEEKLNAGGGNKEKFKLAAEGYLNVELERIKKVIETTPEKANSIKMQENQNLKNGLALKFEEIYGKGSVAKPPKPTVEDHVNKWVARIVDRGERLAGEDQDLKIAFNADIQGVVKKVASQVNVALQQKNENWKVIRLKGMKSAKAQCYEVLRKHFQKGEIIPPSENPKE